MIEILNDGAGTERCCAYPACTTRLSVYNSDFLCWTHADARTRARFEVRNRAGGALRPDRSMPEPSSR
jgi:hypothetical protein